MIGLEPLELITVIVAETADRYRFVTQPDHAVLAGTFADHWGNDDIEHPVAMPPVVMAAYLHDVGWEAYDRRPHLTDEGRPVDFRETPADVWIELYDDGIESVIELDPFAGLLVSMHGAGLRKRRYGLSPGWPETPPRFEPFVERQEAHQSRVLGELLDDGRMSHLGTADAELLSALHEVGRPPDGCRSTLWQAYKLLQAWDTLSLAFCTTLSPPGYGTIDDVPRGNDAADMELSIDSAGDSAFVIESYPFDQDPLEASIPSRTVRKEAFETAGELAQAYYAAGRELTTVTLRGGST